MNSIVKMDGNVDAEAIIANLLETQCMMFASRQFLTIPLPGYCWTWDEQTMLEYIDVNAAPEYQSESAFDLLCQIQDMTHALLVTRSAV